jgi:hypothetical protein
MSMVCDINLFILRKLLTEKEIGGERRRGDGEKRRSER